MREIIDQQLKDSSKLFKDVFLENAKQISKWGIQSRTPFEWMTYLTEEVGELAKAINEREYRDGLDSEVYKEAIQVTTLALKIAEMYREMETRKKRPFLAIMIAPGQGVEKKIGGKSEN